MSSLSTKRIKSYRMRGLVLSFVLFLFAVYLQFQSIQGDPTWFFALVLSLASMVFVVMSFRHAKKPKRIIIATSLLIGSILLMGIDTLSEAMGNGGNGFLYDGLMVSTLYLFIMVPLFVVSLVVLSVATLKAR